MGWVGTVSSWTEGGCLWRLCMLTSETADDMLISIVRGNVCCPLIYDSSFIHSFIQKRLFLSSLIRLHKFLPTYPSLKASSWPISVEGRGHGWSFPESYTDHKVSVSRLVTPLVSRKKNILPETLGSKRAIEAITKIGSLWLAIMSWPCCFETLNFIPFFFNCYYTFSMSKSFHG